MVENGCRVIIVDHEISADVLNNAVVNQIIVEDTHKALGLISAYVKQKIAPKTIGITGSSGKTTLKEMLAAILSNLGNVLATNGNFNNDIGVPLTLLRLEEHHDIAIIEMGANHAGEIAYTTNLVKPDIAIINNIAAAHLEGFGDLAGVANAKGEIFAGLNDSGIAIYNQDSVFTDKWQWRIEDKTVKTVSCHSENKADCFSSNMVLDTTGCASFLLHTPIGNTTISLTLPGVHNVCNAVTAACAAIEMGASLNDISVGLSQMSQVAGRLNLHHLSDQLTLIDDTYNANVESVKAATALLASYKSYNILILGDMGELGEKAVEYHQEIGVYASDKKIDVLFTLGNLSEHISTAFSQQAHSKSIKTRASHFNERSALLSELASVINKKESDTTVSIVVKGSRSAHMEHVVTDIINWHQQTNQTKCQHKEDNT